MPPFPCNPVGSGHQSAIHDEPAADPGSKYDCEDRVPPGRRAVPRFRDGKAVSVIGVSDGASEAAGKVFGKGAAVQPGRVGVAQASGMGVHGARAAHPEPSCPGTRLLLGLLQDAGDGLER